MTIHKTVLLNETIGYLNIKEGDTVVDATLGGGGHSREILKRIGSDGTLIAMDQDIQAIGNFAEFPISNFQFPNKFQIINSNIKKIGNLFLVNDNFSNLENILAGLKIGKVDAILADLGISSDQLADDRGISFQGDAPLDMRMDRTKGITAAEVVNTYEEKEIARILKDFADERYAGSIAKSIVAERNKNQITRTSQLVEVIERSVPGEYRRKKIHCATKTFQALRIEVNRELEALGSFLFQAVETLKPGGRLAIITFHSGEDALVKHTLRENARGCICPPEFPVCRCGKSPIVRLVTRRPVAPGEEEIAKNPRARSAKLRVAEKM